MSINFITIWRYLCLIKYAYLVNIPKKNEEIVRTRAYPLPPSFNTPDSVLGTEVISVQEGIDA